MNTNKWFRLIHRWLSIAFTVGVIVNGVAVSRGKYNNAIGLLALLPLILLLVTGLYLFALPYVARWRGAARTGERASDSEILGLPIRRS